jgi:hypothetical protein
VGVNHPVAGSSPASSAVPFFEVLSFGGLFPVVASQTSFIHPRWDVGAFDFEDRTRVTLPADSRAVHFLKTDFRLVVIVMRGCPLIHDQAVYAISYESGHGH